MKKLYCLLNQLDKLLVISVIRKKILTSSSTVHHMMPSIRVVYSQGSRHNRNIPEFTTKVNRRFDPKSYMGGPGFRAGRKKVHWMTESNCCFIPSASQCRVSVWRNRSNELYFLLPGIGSPESRSATACLKPASSARCLNQIPSGLCLAMPSKRVAIVWVLASPIFS